MLNFKNLVLTLVFIACSFFADNHGAMKAKKDGYKEINNIREFFNLLWNRNKST